MSFFIRVCCENPNCDNKNVKTVCAAMHEEAADDTANELNINSTEVCCYCGNKLVYFSQPADSLQNK